MAADNKAKKKFLYTEVYDSLFKKISEGEIPLENLLPSEKELGKLYSVERTTVRKALDLLVKDGLVMKLPGIGAKVISNEKVVTLSLNSKGSNTILFFLAKTTNNVDRLTQPYYSLMFFHLENELKKMGYQTIYSTLSADDDMELLLKHHSYAGIIFASYGVDRKHLDYVKKNNIPFITVNNDYEKGVFIAPDNFMGGYLVGKHFAELGHRKIGLLRGTMADASCFYRLSGFMTAIKESGLILQEKYCRTASWMADNALVETRHILTENSHDLPTAIFAFNDEMALSAMRIINERGLKVPEDISVAGFDNISQSEYVFPQLTTINCNIEMISRTAVWMLHNKIKNDVIDNFKIIVPVELIVRGSTAPLKK